MPRSLAGWLRLGTYPQPSSDARAGLNSRRQAQASSETASTSACPAASPCRPRLLRSYARVVAEVRRHQRRHLRLVCRSRNQPRIQDLESPPPAAAPPVGQLRLIRWRRQSSALSRLHTPASSRAKPRPRRRIAEPPRIPGHRILRRKLKSVLSSSGFTDWYGGVASSA